MAHRNCDGLSHHCVVRGEDERTIKGVRITLYLCCIFAPGKGFTSPQEIEFYAKHSEWVAADNPTSAKREYTKRMIPRDFKEPALVYTKIFAVVPETGVINDGDTGYAATKEAMEYYLECEKGGWLNEEIRRNV